MNMYIYICTHICHLSLSPAITSRRKLSTDSALRQTIHGSVGEISRERLVTVFKVTLHTHGDSTWISWIRKEWRMNFLKCWLFMLFLIENFPAEINKLKAPILGVATPFGAITLARDLTTPPLPPTWFRVLNLDRWPFLSSQKGATHDLPREAPGKPSMDSFLGRDMGVSRGKSKKHSINWHQSASTMFSHMFSHAFPT